MKLISSFIYAIIVLHLYMLGALGAIVKGKIAPTTQYGKIKAASKGMDKHSMKAKLNQIASLATGMVGAGKTSQRFETKANGHLLEREKHVADLRDATKQVDVSHLFGGAKSQKHLDRAIISGNKKVAKYDKVVKEVADDARKSKADQNAPNYGRLNSFDMMH